MMVPFDGSGAPGQQGGQGGPGGVAPPQPMQMPMGPGGGPQGPGGPGAPMGMPQGPHQHQHPSMNAGGPYGHRNSLTMPGGPGQPPHFMPPSPATRQGSFTGSMPGAYHPPLHSPHHQPQGGPPGGVMHPGMQQMQQHRSSFSRDHMMGQGGVMPPNMGSNQHGDMRNSSQGRQQSYASGGGGSSGGGGGGSGGLNGSWQSDSDTPHRREMIQQIVKLLRKDKNGSPESMSKLPQMAKQLEVSLYRSAQSFDAYVDMSTLKKRLQRIAAEVQRKTRGPNRGPSDSSGRGPGSDDRNRYNDPQSRSQQPPQQQQQHYSSSQNGMRPGQNGGSSPFMGKSNSGGRMGSMSDPLGGSSGRQQGAPSGYDQQYGQHGSSSTTGSSSQNRNDPEWKNRIKHKQQRLLLLHHSAKCPHEDGQCTVTQHCADMKRLWRHMEKCKDNNCRVPHCFSSRAILSHYRKCKDPSCPACEPVRLSVKKSKSSQSQSSQMMGSSSMQSSSSVGHQQNLMHSSDPLAPTGSFQSTSSSIGGSSSQQPRPSGHSGMPPPGHSSSQSRYVNSASQYPNGGTSSSGPVQPLYNASGSQGNSSHAMSSSSAVGSSSRSGPTSSGQQDSEWQKIRHKQQRLLLLRHASRCQYKTGCPTTPHCASMKKLWEHIAHCKNQQCTVQHCLSSRYVLSHYRRCKDPKCPACGPVRETIRKSQQNQQGRQQGPTSVMSDQSNSDAFGSSIAAPTSSPPEMPDAKRRRTDAEHPAVQSSGTSMPAIPSSAASPAAAVKSEAVVDSGKKVEKGKGSGDHSLLNCFSVEQLETHLASLDRKTQLSPAKLKSKCSEVLKGLQSHQHGWVFISPVDPVELGLPDYFEIIKKPMDLGTIQKKLENGAYHAIEDFQADVNLTFDNAMTYNEDGSVVYGMAKELKTKFEGDMERLMAQLAEEDLERRQNERACTLCGCEKLMFEPPVYFCNGMNCQNQRIRRNSHFYIGGNNQYFWCSTCYNELDEKLPIELPDLTINKADLKKKKNDETHEESWVQCDSCERWVHQVCGLFNTRQNREQHTEYCCPRCLLKRQKESGAAPSPRPLSAVDLPRTMLSEWLEKHVMKKVERKKRQMAEDKVQSENITLEQALSQVESGGPIHIRQVTSMDRKLEVRELMKKRYEHKKYPDEFPFRCKCIVVFQELDGVDVVLFALYVYEHGEDNPPPNKRAVYISYLDSVHFMRPRRLRTYVYHEILIAYLDYARRKGFATAHIWACPPLKGDDYIFYAKPEDQKTPRDSRLRQWYIDMLVECQKRNIVGKVTNMYDLYFADEKLDATAVPYLEGDYFPGEAENIIKMIEEGGGKKGGGAGKKKKSKNTKNKGTTGTRSTGVDEQALLDSGMLKIEDLDRDQVMVKLGETIQPMKESFIVAFLNWSGAREEDLIVPEEIEKARIEYAAKGDNDITGSKRDALGNIRDAVSALDKDGKPVKVIDDDSEDLDCEFLNNRQAFLNLCRGNHYQFDELRRAKHTSMMVLWHLHNRDAPKFVQQCVVCSREIISGKRYHCNTCPDYDLCQECYSNPKTNRGACTHKLQAIAVDPESSQGQSGLSEAEIKHRQRNLELHIQLIEHASRCTSKQCSSSNCVKMKTYLAHSRTCRIKAGGGCRICKRIWTLLRIHAQRCKNRTCPIPQCNAIREKMRQLQKQQQAMDDRRRLEMNRHMRFSITGGSGQ